MTAIATLQRRPIRTKEAASYLSISDWKLRRLIQDGTFPVVQNQEGGPFLLDIRDLDGLIENHKRTILGAAARGHRCAPPRLAPPGGSAHRAPA